jgi:hypothetical protein
MWSRRLAALVVLALPLASCTPGTWIIVHVSAAAGVVATDMHLTITLDTPPSTRQTAIQQLPHDTPVLLPDRAIKLTATLTGTLAGAPFTRSATIESVPRQQRTLNLEVGGAAPPDMAPLFDLGADQDLGGDHEGSDLAGSTPLGLANALTLTGTAPTLTGAVPVAAGQLLLLAVYWNQNLAMISVSDTLGQSWKMMPEYSNPITTCSNQAGSQLQLWYAENAKPGMMTVTVTEGPGSNPMGAFLLLYSGVALSNALETQSGAATNTASNLMAVPALKTSGDGDLVVAVFNDAAGDGAMMAGDGYTAVIVDQSYIAMIEESVGVAPGMHAVTGKEPNGVSDGCWVGAAAAFKKR